MIVNPALNSDLPSECVTAAVVAQYYFRGGKTKSEIAALIGTSRFKVARILDRCLAERLVQIVFHFPDDFIDYELSTELKMRFGLRHSLVVADAGQTEAAILDALGRATALLLKEMTVPGDVLGFAWTRTFEAMTAHIPPLRARSVVQLCGAFPGAGQGRTSIEIVREVARCIDGPAYFFYAPLLASDPQAASAIRRQADVQAAKAMFAQVSKAVVTIGAWDQASPAFGTRPARRCGNKRCPPEPLPRFVGVFISTAMVGRSTPALAKSRSVSRQVSSSTSSMS